MPTSPEGILERRDDEGDGLHLLSLVNILLRQRVLVTRVLLVVLLFAAVKGLAKSRTYTSAASFVVQSRRTNGLQGLAAQFGIAVPTGEGGQSPNFYEDLIRSREILGAVVDSVSVAVGGQRQSLADIFKITDPDLARRRERAILALRAHITANVAQRTGVIEFHVTTESPVVSQLIAQRIIDQINDFNLLTRQTQAAAERRFTERRLNEVRKELHDAEAELLTFAQHNRDIRNAPELLVQQDRLQREVTLRQSLYGTLAQAFEQAKIEEVRDTPLISPVENAARPALPDGRGLTMLLGVALVLGSLLAVILAALSDRAHRTVSADVDSIEFEYLRGQIAADLRRPWRLLVPR